MSTLKDANNSIKTEVHKNLVNKEKEKYEIAEQLNHITDQITKMQKATQQYEVIELERKRFLRYNYIKQDPTDVESMFAALKGHVETIS